MPVWALLAVLVFSAAPAARAGEAAEANAAALIQKLKSDDVEERDAARAALLALGDGVRAELNQALEGAAKDLDFSAQLRRVLRELGQSGILRRYDEPKRVDLELAGATVADALLRLKKEFGWEVKASGNTGEKKVDVSVKGARFFEALEAIRAAGKLSYSIVRGGGREEGANVLPVSLGELGEKGVSVACVAGPFLAFGETVGANLSQNFNLAQGSVQENKNVYIQGHLLAEPDLPSAGVELRELQISDAKELSFKSDYGSLYPENLGTATSVQCYQFQANLHAAAGLAAPVALKGALAVLVPLKMQTRRIENLAEGGSLTVGGGTLSVEKPKNEGNAWKVHFKASGTVGDLMDGRTTSFRRGRMGAVAAAGRARGGGEGEGVPKDQPGLFWLDDAGRPMDSNGYSSSGGNAGRDVDMNFTKEPKTLVVQWVEEKAERKYDLEFKGIPLP